MSGLYTNGMPELAQLIASGAGIPIDTGYAGGENPETASLGMLRLATMLNAVGENVDRATVAGSRYYRQYKIGYQCQLTGVEFLVGSTGGTDNIIVELHDSAGALLATSALAGTLLGTANLWQQIAFTAPVVVAAGTYYLAIQSNGNTGKLRAFQYPGLIVPVGSAVGVFGTSAAIVPPTTYTAGVGPVCEPY